MQTRKDINHCLYLQNIWRKSMNWLFNRNFSHLLLLVILRISDTISGTIVTWLCMKRAVPRTGMFEAVNSFLVTRSPWLILLSKFWLFFKYSKVKTKHIWNYKDSEVTLIYYILSIVFESLAILWFFGSGSINIYIFCRTSVDFGFPLPRQVALPTEAWRGAERRRRSAENVNIDLPGPWFFTK
jgi:hypothetical protein